ncbi:MAG TPA: COQ9 family protein [Dongiaceae bacterium]|jgi:ubiquinone biosynthesis protein COQ9
MARKAKTEGEALRDKLLTATLAHVPFDGWTQTAFDRAIEDTGADRALALNAFPRGVGEIIEYFHRLTDRRMVAELEKRDLAGYKLRQKIALALRLRFEINAGHREAIRQGLAFLALPTNAHIGLISLYRTVDAIWYAVGDRSADFNYYSKRALLAGVYTASVFYWLSDKSERSEETWAFINRRIEDVMRIQKLRGKIDSLIGQLPDPFRLLRGVGR